MTRNRERRDGLEKAAEATRRIVKRAVAECVFPGCVVGIVDRAGSYAVVHVGRLTYEKSAPKVCADTVYDAASVTKVVPTSVLALMALDRGLLTVQSLVRQFIPELGGPYRDMIRVHHLLSHTLDFGFALSSLKELSASQLLDRILSAPLGTPPGSRFVYSNATSILLGLVVERVFGDGLDVLARRLLFAPLGMRESWLHRVPSSVISRTAPTENDPWRARVIRGETHDESAWRLAGNMCPGSAGLFTTVPDMLQFLRMILGGGALNGTRLLASATVERIFQNQVAHLGSCTGLGWEMGQPQWMGACASRLVGKTGFTGCALMVDYFAGRGLAMLANWTWPIRRQHRREIDAVRRAVADEVFADSTMGVAANTSGTFHHGGRTGH